MFHNGFGKWYLFSAVVGLAIAGNQETVHKWASDLDIELRQLMDEVSRPDELKNSYNESEARVEDKSGEELIKIISESVGRMMRRKMDAVRCIANAAEKAAEEYKPSGTLFYVSGKYSHMAGMPEPYLPESVKNNSYLYRAISLTNDSHFYNIPVNTNCSSVHVPTNVYDMTEPVNETIQWSEALDDTFKQNYQSDPALSWQYFGSRTGILRQFPAMQWRMEKTKDDKLVSDSYDCRIRSWYIEAATCSKDMVILFDSSGSMTGMPNAIAKETVSAIFETLSNNDFVTIIDYSNVTQEMGSCFKDKLIQATPENLLLFKDWISKIKTNENANVTEAMDKAFALLKTYREDRNCDSDTPCNQVIMLVTDGVPGNLSEVYRKWNYVENGTHIPVRVFTYLIGREVTKVEEIQELACKNRGYFSHVRSLEEVRGQVLKYTDVIARPLVLQKFEHPVIWTHAYTDISNPALASWLLLVMQHPDQMNRLEKHLKGKQQGVQINEDAIYIQHTNREVDGGNSPGMNKTIYQEYGLLTSVSIPVFDTKANQDNETKKAILLGVAGTDVPLDEIRRLTLPYKLGVNGYAFIVSNNGYVVLHPALSPVSKGHIKLNFNSVDLAEVEMLNDDSGPRNLGKEVLELRKALVFPETGSMKGISVKLHYDDKQRVTLDERDYFYEQLSGSPFGIAIALPGNSTWIKVDAVIRKIQCNDTNVSDLFVGKRWRVHSDWVYCRYHYLEGHEFSTPEEELREFLAKLRDPNWEFPEQYTAPPKEAKNDNGEPNCGRKSLENDDYYCNEELMQLLVFDANITNQYYTEQFEYSSEESQKLVEKYNVSLRFVATQSGLTRWQYLDENSAAEDGDTEFGDLHSRAVNEPWYKGAIFQHRIKPKSIYLTVPLGAGEEATVTASQGIALGTYPKDAPAAVVGFQMPMQALRDSFMNITSHSQDIKCLDDTVDCYLLDQNGYIVIAEDRKNAGKFFGTIEGAVMKSMLLQRLYTPVTIYDYQALCSRIIIVKGVASIFTNPLKHMWELLMWFFIRVAWFTNQLVDLPMTFAKSDPNKDKPADPPPDREEDFFYACDQVKTLYILNQTIASITNTPSYYTTPYFTQKLNDTNLLLVVVDNDYIGCYDKLDVTAEEIFHTDYLNSTNDTYCHKLDLNNLPRRPLNGCFTEHKDEFEIKDCGRGSRLETSLLATVIVILTMLCNVLQ